MLSCQFQYLAHTKYRHAGTLQCRSFPPPGRVSSTIQRRAPVPQYPLPPPPPSSQSPPPLPRIHHTGTLVDTTTHPPPTHPRVTALGSKKLGSYSQSGNAPSCFTGRSSCGPSSGGCHRPTGTLDGGSDSMRTPNTAAAHRDPSRPRARQQSDTPSTHSHADTCSHTWAFNHAARALCGLAATRDTDPPHSRSTNDLASSNTQLLGPAPAPCPTLYPARSPRDPTRWTRRPLRDSTRTPRTCGVSHVTRSLDTEYSQAPQQGMYVPLGYVYDPKPLAMYVPNGSLHPTCGVDPRAGTHREAHSSLARSRKHRSPPTPLSRPPTPCG